MMKPEKSILEYLNALEMKLISPAGRKSTEELSVLLSDNFMEIGTSGRVYNKEQVINALVQELTCKIFIEDFNAVQLSPGVVLVNYKAAKVEEGDDKKVYSLRSSIWQLTGKGWQIVFHQGTLIPK